MDASLATRLSGSETPHRRCSLATRALCSFVRQVPALRRHDQICVISIALSCRRQLHRAIGPSPSARIDDMIKAVWRLHCLVLVGSSSTDQLGHLPVPASSRHDQGCVPFALPVLVAPAPQSSRATSRCPHRDDMIMAGCHLHCLVLVGVSSTEQSDHLQVSAPRRHDQGCMLFALPCPCRRRLHRAVRPPSGARIETS